MRNVNLSQASVASVQANATLGLARFEVLSVDSGSVYIKQMGDDRIFEAVCAVSCILEPVAGDQVLVHLDGLDQPAFVIAVLVRTKPACETSYRLSDTVSFVADKNQLKINAPSFGISAVQAKLEIDQLQGIYKEVTQAAESVSLVAGEATHKVGRFIARLRDSFRFIEGLDRTQAGNIDQSAQYQISLDADITKVNAQHVVKVQAKKIDLG